MKISYEYLNKEYVENGRSWSELGKELGLFPNTIRRQAIKLGIKVRNQSEAQKLALKSGTRKHPMKGKTHNLATKTRIGKKLSENWNNSTEAEKDIIRNKRKEQWENTPESLKESMRTQAAKAVRATSKDGSKMEKFILHKLRENKFKAEFHYKQLIVNEKLECDIYLPELQVCLEIDGPSHFQPIYGEEVLAKTRLSDQIKNGLLISKGYWMVRIRAGRKTTTPTYMNLMADKVLETLNAIKNGTLKTDTKLIYIEE